MKALNLVLFTILFCTGVAKGQTFTVLPNSPTENDVVKIAVAVSTCCPAKKVSLTHSIVQGDIFITGCYGIKNGLAEAYTFNDTLTIGTLSEGIYNVIFKTYQGFDTTACTNVFDSNLTTGSFEVFPIMPVSQTILPQNANEDDSVKIAVKVKTPNPARKISLSYTLGQNHILIDGCFAKTQSTALAQTFHDTLVVGKLQQGKYWSHFTAFYSEGDTNICDVVVDFTQVLDSFTVIKTVFVDDHKPARASVYPNPTAGEVNILLPDGLEIGRIAVQNVTGRIVKTVTSNKFSIAELPDGVYILKVQTNAGRFVHKLRKE